MESEQVPHVVTAINGRRYQVDITLFARDLVEWAPEFGVMSRARREYLGFSQFFVASWMKDYLGIPWHQTVVAKIESGKRQVKLHEAVGLSLLYGMSIENLITGHGAETTTGLVDIGPVESAIDDDDHRSGD